MAPVSSPNKAPAWAKPKQEEVVVSDKMNEGGERAVVVEDEQRTIFVASDDNAALRKAMYGAVMKKIHAGQMFHLDGSSLPVELHSADNDSVYIFGKNRGNGDKRNCEVMPIWEFCDRAGIRVSLESAPA